MPAASADQRNHSDVSVRALVRYRRPNRVDSPETLPGQRLLGRGDGQEPADPCAQVASPVTYQCCSQAYGDRASAEPCAYVLDRYSSDGHERQVRECLEDVRDDGWRERSGREKLDYAGACPHPS